jgi:hypothetical protein
LRFKIGELGPETKSNARNVRISGLVSRVSGRLAERRTAWLAAQC